MTTTTPTLADIIKELTTASPCPHSSSLEEAMKNPGCVVEVDEETYDFYLDALPPRFMTGSVFCFAEGFAPYTLFWRRRVPQCASPVSSPWDETQRIYTLAGIPPPGFW